MNRDGCIIKRASLYRIVACAALLALGCRLDGRLPAMDPPQPDDSDKGTLVLTLNLTALSQLTLVPLISMQIVSFDIQGTGPDPLTDTFSDLGNTTGLLELGGLTPGYWTITVDARNVDGTIIGHGQTDPPVLITAGQVTDAQITIAPLSGTGGLQLVVEWPKDTHTGATVQCSLVSMATGVDLAPAFSLTPDKKPFRATHKNPAIEAGYYLLLLRLYDSGTQFWGIAEAVRIVAGQTTSQTWNIN